MKKLKFATDEGKKLLILFMLFISVNAFCQNQDSTLNNTTTKKIVSPSLRVDLGLFHPILNFRKSLNANKINPSLGFYMGNHISNELRLDLGITMEKVINSSDSISFVSSDTVLFGQVDGVGTAGLWLTKRYELRDNLFGDIRFGSGWALIGTNILKDSTKEDYYNLSTLFFNFGTEIKRVVFQKRLLGISINYFFVPYNLFKNRLGNDFGNQYLSTTILYNF